MSGFTHEAPVPASMEWYTPPWLLEDLGMAFDLDPCHPWPPLPWADRFFGEVLTKHEDGLATPWPVDWSVFMNPPYGDQTPLWLAKLAAHGRVNHDVGGGMALVFSRTDTAWFHDVARAKPTGILFLEGRVRFVDRSGEPPRTLAKDGKLKVKGPGVGSMLVAWGAECHGGLQTFKRKHGGCLIHP